jgi:hypothetical protein
VECSINGTVVATYDKSALVTQGKLKSTDGTYGCASRITRKSRLLPSRHTFTCMTTTGFSHRGLLRSRLLLRAAPAMTRAKYGRGVGVDRLPT